MNQPPWVRPGICRPVGVPKGEQRGHVAETFERRLGVAAGDIGEQLRRDEDAGAAADCPGRAQPLDAVLQADVHVAASVPAAHVRPVAVNEGADDDAAAPRAAELNVAAALRSGEPAAAALRQTIDESGVGRDAADCGDRDELRVFGIFAPAAAQPEITAGPVEDRRRRRRRLLHRPEVGAFCACANRQHRADGCRRKQELLHADLLQMVASPSRVRKSPAGGVRVLPSVNNYG